MALKYVSTLDLAKALGIKTDVPSWDIGTAPLKESVGGVNTQRNTFYLDHRNILNNSFTIYYGNSTAGIQDHTTTTSLTNVTDYDLDLDSGRLIPTATGANALGSALIFAEYSYCNLDIPDSYLQTILERAEKWVEEKTKVVFVDSTGTTPPWGSRTNESQSGKGWYNREYYSDFYPIANFSTYLTSALPASFTTAAVDSTRLFATSGIIEIGGNKVSYTNKTATAFIGLGGVSSSHTVGVTALPYVVEVSTTARGSEPTWTILNKDSDYDINFESGKVHIYRQEFDSTIFSQYAPPEGVPNRFRVSYLYGYDNIPEDLKRAIILTALIMMSNDTMVSSLVKGRNEFKPEMINSMKEERDSIIDNYTSVRISNI